MSGRYWARTSVAGVPLSAVLAETPSFCRQFSVARPGGCSAVNNFLRLLMWSIGGQPVLLMQ